MHNWKLDDLVGLLAECGKIALKYYQNPHIELKPDNTVVTLADQEIEQLLCQRFDRPEAGCYLLGEETIGNKDEAYLEAALKAPLCYIVDPIDGTAPYSAQVPLWGVSIGLMQFGKLVEGAIYLPVPDIATVSLKGSLWEVKNLQTDHPEVTPFTPVRAPLNAAGHISIAQGYAKVGKIDFPNQVFAWSSCVGSYHYLLRGHLLGYVQHAKIWDLAGSLPLLKAANFINIFRDGEEIDLALNNRQFQLQAEGPKRWALRQFAVAAPDRQTANYIWDHISHE